MLRQRSVAMIAMMSPAFVLLSVMLTVCKLNSESEVIHQVW